MTDRAFLDTYRSMLPDYLRPGFDENRARFLPHTLEAPYPRPLEPTMSVFATAAADIEAFRSKLADDAHHLIGEFEALLGKLKGDAEADAAQVAHDAAPVIAEAEHDAGALAAEAVAGAEGIVDPAKPSA